MGLGDSVAVNGEDATIADLELHPDRREPHVEVPLPEVLPPPIVVASHHGHRHPLPHPPDLGGDMKPDAGDQPAVGEPEIEDVAVEEEAVAERRRALEEGEEGLLDLGRGGAHMGVGQDEEALTEHDRR